MTFNAKCYFIQGFFFMIAKNGLYFIHKEAYSVWLGDSWDGDWSQSLYILHILPRLDTGQYFQKVYLIHSFWSYTLRSKILNVALRCPWHLISLKNKNKNVEKRFDKLTTNLLLKLEICSILAFIKPTFFYRYVIGKNKLFKVSLNNKNSITFAHIKLLLTSFFALKIVEL